MSDVATKTSSVTMSQTPFDINVRKDIKWDFAKVEARFVLGNPLISYLWAGMSAGAPPIERFFIKQLKPTIDTIKDDKKLIQDVQDMIAQEIQHSLAHLKLNKHLATLGYDIKGSTKLFEGILHKMTKDFTPVDMLGVVAAGEHALYSFAKVFVNSPEIRETMHPDVERLFLYHFLEEAEHGAVSHDQYRYFAGNKYFHRLKTAFRARYVISMFSQVTNLFARGFNYKPTLMDRYEFFYYLWGYPGVLRKVTFHLLAYLAPWYKLTFTHEDLETLKAWNEQLYARQKE